MIGPAGQWDERPRPPPTVRTSAGRPAPISRRTGAAARRDVPAAGERGGRGRAGGDGERGVPAGRALGLDAARPGGAVQDRVRGAGGGRVEPAAVIPVARVRGPVLLSCGGLDRVWPSCPNVDDVTTRLAGHGFRYPVTARVRRRGALRDRLRAVPELLGIAARPDRRRGDRHAGGERRLPPGCSPCCTASRAGPGRGPPSPSGPSAAAALVEQGARIAHVGVAPPGPEVPAGVAQQPGPAAVCTTDDSVVHQPLLSVGN